VLSLQTSRNTRFSSVVTFARSCLKITSRSFRYAALYLWNQLPHSLHQRRLDLPILDSSLLRDQQFTSVIITTLIIHHPIIRFSQSQNFFFSNFTLHRYLAPLRNDFVDIRTALRFFFVSVFFLVSVIIIFFFLVFLSKAYYLSHNHLFLDFF